MFERLAPTLALLFCLTPHLHAENILLISIDTLRADRLSCYGYRNNTTPNIDRWASEGVLFEKAYTEVPLTLPSHSTLFTGTYPFHHGVRENVGFVLNPDFVTLAEIFREQGYRTAGFAGAFVLSSRLGIAQGFSHYDEDFGVDFEASRAATVQRPAKEVTDRFLQWLEDNSESNFFAFVHFFDPHTPRPNGYDWEVTQVDHSIGRIDEFLRSHSLLEKTHVVVLSDHGESLGEHGESGHGFFIYDSTLHIPLILRPAVTSTFSRHREPAPVSLVDVAPTLLQLAGLDVPPVMQGRSLFRLLLEKSLPPRPLYAETFVPELHFGWSPLRSLRMDRYKYIEAPRSEFYDLTEDALEQENLFPRQTSLAARYEEEMQGLITRYAAATPPDSSRAVDIRTRENLASLGYASLQAPRVQEAFSRGIDPKDRIETFEDYHWVLNEIQAGSTAPEVLERIAKIRREAPEIRGLFYLEGQAQEQLGRLEAALSSYLLSVEKEPENNPARARLGHLLIRAGKYAEAESELTEVLRREPEDYRSRNNLAGLYQMSGRTADAIRQLELAVEADTGYAAGWLNLGRLYVLTQRWDAAEKALRRAVQLEEQNALAQYHLGLLLQSLGRSEEAEARLRKARELDPRLP